MAGGASEASWLYQRDGMLLGPTSTKVLVERLYKGEIDGSTLVSLASEERFVPLAQVPAFQSHLARAQVQVRVEQQTAAEAAEDSSGRRARILALAIGGSGLLIGFGALAWWLATERPWRKAAERELVVAIAVDAPTIGIGISTGEEDVAIPVGDAPNPNRPAGEPGSASRRTRKVVAPGEPGGTGDGLETGASFDRAAIDEVVAQKVKSLHPCILEMAKQHPEESGRLPMEFTVGNDGKVTKLWVDHPQHGSGPTYECLFGVLKGWKFPPYPGEQANVSLGFNYGPKR